MPQPGDLEFLMSTKLFDSIPRTAICRLLNCLQPKHLKAGERLFSQGDAADSLYIIQEGRCAIKLEKDGEIHPVARLREGDVVGEIAVLTGGVRSAHVDADTEVKLWGLGSKQFEEVAARHPDLRVFLTELVTDRFEQAPYAAEPTDREKVQVLNVLVPRRVTVTDLVHGTREELTFNKDGEKFGYFPDSASTSRFRTAALLTNGGLQLEDRHGNTITLDPAWKFRALRPDFRAGLVQSVAMADQTARFRWTIDGTGRVVVASAELTMGKDASQPSQIVRYHYADDGRLARVTRSDPTHPRRVPLAGCQPVPSAAS
jgi:CRP-like cAMP-binding protein